jgi:hypothetical protein
MSTPCVLLARISAAVNNCQVNSCGEESRMCWAARHGQAKPRQISRDGMNLEQNLPVVSFEERACLHLRESRGITVKIAQVAPLIESVPPKLYGGTERIVSYLTEELVRQGHEVTLFASGDSVTAARLAPTVERALRLYNGCRDHLAWHFLMLEDVFQRGRQFDVIHFHMDYLHLPLASRSGVRYVTTLHGRLDLPPACMRISRSGRGCETRATLPLHRVDHSGRYS